MTRLEKLAEINAMSKFLDHVIQDCDFCPCMEDGICNGSCGDCIKKI